MVVDPSDPEGEAELVARSRDGDDRAFTMLLRYHDERMRSLAYRMLGGRAAMDDALQDAYLKAYRSLPKFKGDSSFSTWLYRIVTHTCIDHARKRDRRREVPLELVTPTGAATTSGPDVQVTERSAIAQALAGLPADQRAAVLLIDGEGLSYGQAAEVVGTKPGTVASRLSRARSSLRATLSLTGGAEQAAPTTDKGDR